MEPTMNTQKNRFNIKHYFFFGGWLSECLMTLCLAGCGGNQTTLASLPVALPTLLPGSGTVSSAATTSTTTITTTGASTTLTPGGNTPQGLESATFFSMTSANASSPLVLVDAQSRVSAFWLQSFDNTAVPGVWVAQRTATQQQWGAPVQLDSYSRQGAAASTPMAVVDHSGNVIACWLQTPPNSVLPDLWCAAQSAGGSNWSAPQLMAQSQANSAGISSPVLAVNPSTGSLALAWISGLASGGSVLQVSAKVAGDPSWPATQTVVGTVNGSSPAAPALVFTKNSDLVTLAWNQANSQGVMVVYAMQQLGQGGWGKVTPVDGSLPSGNGGDSAPQLTTDFQDNVVALWSQGVTQGQNMVTILKSASLTAGSWTKPVEVDALSGTNGTSEGSQAAQLTTLQNGAVAAVWQQSFSTSSSPLVGVTNYFIKATWSASGWSAPQSVPLPSSWLVSGTLQAPAGGPWLLGDTQGNEVVTWIQNSPTTGIAVVESLFLQAGATTLGLTPVQVSTGPFAVSALSSVMQGSGQVDSLWIQFNGNNNQVFAAIQTP